MNLSYPGLLALTKFVHCYLKTFFLKAYWSISTSLGDIFLHYQENGYDYLHAAAAENSPQ